MFMDEQTGLSIAPLSFRFAATHNTLTRHSGKEKYSVKFYIVSYVAVCVRVYITVIFVAYHIR